MHRYQLMRSGANGKFFFSNHILNFLSYLFTSISIVFLAINSVCAQTVITKVEAATMDSFSGADSVLPSLPGVLIAGLALIFAIRERGFAREFKSKLEDADFTQRKAEKETAHYRAIFDHSNVGLWQVDIRGMTIYANTAMCELLSIENIEEIKDIPDRKFLDISKAPRTNNSPSYQTILVDKNGSRHEVYVSEQTVVHDADAMSVRVRTVVDINRLTLDRDDTNQKNEPRHLETSAEQTGNKFTAAA